MRKFAKKLYLGLAIAFLSTNLCFATNAVAEGVDDEQVVGHAEIKNDVKYIKDDGNNDKILEYIQRLEKDNPQKVILKVDKYSDKEIKSLKKNEIFYIEPTEDKPFGYIGKVEKIKNRENEEKEIKIIHPSLDEVFSDIDVENEEGLSFDNIVSYDLPKGAYLQGSIEHSNIPSIYSGMRMNKIYDNIDKLDKSEDQYKINNICIGFKDSTIFDGDGNLNTIDDQIKLTGVYQMNNSSMDMTIKVKKSKVNQLKSRFITTLDVNSGINIKADRKLNINKNDKFVLGSLIFNVGNLKAKLKNNLWVKVPVGVTVFLTMDLKGNVNANAMFCHDYSCYIDRGIYINREDNSKSKYCEFNLFADGNSYPNPNATNEEPTTQQKNSVPKITYYAKGTGDMKFDFGTELNAGVTISGICPVNIINRMYGYGALDMKFHTDENNIIKGNVKFGVKSQVEIQFKDQWLHDFNVDKDKLLFDRVFCNWKM